MSFAPNRRGSDGQLAPLQSPLERVLFCSSLRIIPQPTYLFMFIRHTRSVTDAL